MVLFIQLNCNNVGWDVLSCEELLELPGYDCNTLINGNLISDLCMESCEPGCSDVYFPLHNIVIQEDQFNPVLRDNESVILSLPKSMRWFSYRHRL